DGDRSVSYRALEACLALLFRSPAFGPRRSIGNEQFECSRMVRRARLAERQIRASTDRRFGRTIERRFARSVAKRVTTSEGCKVDRHCWPLSAGESREGSDLGGRPAARVTR